MPVPRAGQNMPTPSGPDMSGLKSQVPVLGNISCGAGAVTVAWNVLQVYTVCDDCGIVTYKETWTWTWIKKTYTETQTDRP